MPLWFGRKIEAGDFEPESQNGVSDLHLQTQTANNILLLHLGTLDTLIGLLFLTFALPDLYHYDALFEGTPCVINGFVFTLLHSMNLWTICGLNCDRYYAIAAPLHYGHLVSPKKVSEVNNCRICSFRVCHCRFCKVLCERCKV